MVKLLIDFVQFLYTLAPLFVSLAILTLLAILLSKSIRKHAGIYYSVLAIPLLLVAVPFFLRLFGVETYNLVSIPFLGIILRDYIHMGTLGFPLLIIIMYIGALNPKNEYVKRLMSIRKELSIISGFPVLTHTLIRVANNFPKALQFFTDNEGYLATTKVSNELGAGITNFSLVLGILLVVLFIPLWVTSFGPVRKRMGNVRWKKLQRWSYVMYALLFIHAMGLQIGYGLNPRVRDLPKAKATVEVTDSKAGGRQTTENLQTKQQERTGRNEMQAGDKQAGKAKEKEQAANKNRRMPSKGFADIEVSAQTKRCIHIASLLLIFGSYLYLRVRKAKKDTARK